MDDIEVLLCQDSGMELVILEAIVSLSLGHNLTSYEQNLFGNFLQAIGQNLCLLSIRKGKCINDKKKCSEDKNQSSAK